MAKNIRMYEVYRVVPNKFGWGPSYCREKDEADGLQARMTGWTDDKVSD